jgi:hypothetical protein
MDKAQFLSIGRIQENATVLHCHSGRIFLVVRKMLPSLNYREGRKKIPAE